jgi:hypothetical protein
MCKTRLAKAAIHNLILLNTIMLKILRNLERVLSESKKANAEWDGAP